MSDDKAYILLPGETDGIPLPTGATTDGKPVVDVSSLAKKGVVVLDLSMRNTAPEQSAITNVNGKDGELLFRGIPVGELADKCDYLEVCHLLIKGELPTKQQYDDFKKQVGENTVLDNDLRNALAEEFKSPSLKKVNPMNLLAKGTNILSSQDKKMQECKTSEEMAIRVTAIMPILMAIVHNVVESDYFTFPEKEDFGKDFENFNLMGNLLAMMHGRDTEQATNADAIRAMDRIFIVHADHGNEASTFVAGAITSTSNPGDIDIWGAITGGIMSLKGPRHGGANINVLNMFEEIAARSEDTVEEKVSGFIADTAAHNAEVKQSGKGRKKLFDGMGHAVYRGVEDPRAKAIKDICDKVADPDNELYQIAVEFRKQQSESPHKPNVDFFSGLTQTAANVSKEMLTASFATSRGIGWTVEALEHNRSITRPQDVYVGQAKRTVEAARQEAVRKAYINDGAETKKQR